MTIAVNLTWLDPGRVGGSEQYLTRQLAGLDPDAVLPELELFVGPGFTEAHPALAERYRVHVAPAARGGRAARIVSEHTWLAARTRRAEVVHHGGGTAPAVGGRPVVLTVHDLQYRTFPHYFGTVRRRYLAAMVPRSVRRAAVVAVPSEFVRHEVVDAFGAAPDRVVVVPHGVPELAVPATDDLARLRAEWGIGDRPFVVYPAITHPHKGHRVLVDMVEHLPDELMLVLVGGSGPAEAALAERIARSPARRRIVRTGRVPASQRNGLVAEAEAMVFPSEFEGFGAPLVEAMALGTPVVAGTAAAVREVVGPAGVIVDGSDGADWAAAVESARRDRAQLVAAGRERRALYTIEASGRALADAYGRALS